MEITINLGILVLGLSFIFLCLMFAGFSIQVKQNAAELEKQLLSKIMKLEKDAKIQYELLNHDLRKLKEKTQPMIDAYEIHKTGGK